MKSSKKVLALALAAAMVVTAVPATNAEAATTGVTKSKTCYAGKSFNLTLTTPSSWKSVKTTWTTSKKSVAKVAKKSTKKVKVTGVKAGTATVKVKVTAKKSGKKVSKTYTCKVTVKNPALTLKAANEVAVGATEQITATVKPTGTKVTYTTSDAAIATVDEKGVVTGVKDGEVTITAKAGKTTKTVKMTVKKYVVKSVKQTKANTFEAVVLGKTADIKASDITVSSKTTNMVYAVKSVSADKNDATKVTFETFAELKDGATYTVTLAGTATDVTVTDGVVKKVAVTPVQIPADTDGTEIKGQLLDKDGIVISEFKSSDASRYSTDLKITTTQGYVNGDKLVLPVVGNKATAEITYHTYKYDANAKEEGALTEKVEIVAVEKAAVTTTGYEVTIAKDKADWAKKNNQLSASDTTKAFFRFMTSENKEVSDYSKYSVVSSDDTVLLLAKTQLTGTKNPSVTVRGIKAGSAYINVLDKDGKVITSLPVVVTADRKLTSVKIDSTALTVANNINSTVSTGIKGVDQYGADYTAAFTTEVLSKPNDAKTAADFVTAGTDKITVNAAGATEGTYTVKVTAKASDNTTVVRTITVRVVKSDVTDVTKATNLGLKLSATDVDLAIGDDTTAADIAKKDITVSVVAYSNGAEIGTVDLKDVKVNGDATHVSGSVINLTTVKAGKTEKNFAAGTYTVAATTTTGKVFNGVFTVKDTQSSSVAAKVESKDLGANKTAADVVAANVKFSINGADYVNIPASQITVSDFKAADNAIYVGTVKVAVTNNAGVVYDVPVSINTTFSK